MSQSRRSLDGRQRGLALVMVLWAAIVLALIAGGVMRIGRDDVNLARNLVEATQAELAADSALWRAVHAVALDEDDGWRADGSIYGWRFAGAEVRVAVSDEMGRVDLNAASPELLTALLAAAGAGETAPDFVAELLALRAQRQAAADKAAKEAAEEQNPTATGTRILRRLPPPAFLLTDEVAQLPGMTPDLWRRVEPALTVYTGVPTPVHAASPPLVRAALAGEVAADSEDQGADDAGSGGEGRPALISGATEQRRLVSRLLRVQAEARTAGGAYFAREAVIALTGRDGFEYRVRAWKKGERKLFPLSHVLED